MVKTRVPAKPAHHSFAHEVLVRGDRRILLVQIVHGENIEALTQTEHRSIAELCAEPRSVAEVATLLSVPLGVAKVLLGDMAGHLGIDVAVVDVHQELVLRQDLPDAPRGLHDVAPGDVADVGQAVVAGRESEARVEKILRVFCRNRR